MYSYRTETLSPEYIAQRNRKARDGARDLLSNYLPLVKSKDRVRDLVEQEHELSSDQYWELQGYIRATSRKIVTIHQQAENAEGGVDWPEEHVIHAIRTLTALDEDQGKYNNKVGWNPRISGKGHWCNARLDAPGCRHLAIKLGRTLVGSYREQLERNYVRAVHPLPPGWVPLK